jgi:hypothetical protein
MSEKDILKEFGDVLLEASYIVDNPPPIISVTPKIDIALGGGVPEGCLFPSHDPFVILPFVHFYKTLKHVQFCQPFLDLS